MRLEWDEVGKRFYRTGCSKGVLALYGDSTVENFKPYSNAVAWSGLTNVTQSPSGAESNPVWADNIKYLNLTSAEEFGATIEALSYPDEFGHCDGSAEIAPGITIGQQSRALFGFSYQEKIGSDINDDLGYTIHIIYGCKAAPSEKSSATVSDSPEAQSMSWEISTTPVNIDIPGTKFKPTSIMSINSTTTDPAKLKALEDIIYGTESVTARLPLPAEVIELVGAGTLSVG